MIDHSYLYKVLTSVICYISGETDITSGYDYLCLKNKPTKKTAEISNVKIIHHKRQTEGLQLPWQFKQSFPEDSLQQKDEYMNYFS